MTGTHSVGGAGRFAPSPSGDLHIGNIRTGLLSYVRARQTGRRFLWRVEDLDRVKTGAADSQLEVFADLGVVPDERPLVQSERTAEYSDAIARLAADGLVYECYCSRKDIAQAPSAPHAPPGAYPGTCRSLGEGERESARRRLEANNRQPALRLHTDNREHSITDVLLGRVEALVDDLVLRRGDGVYAYNLTVVVDDAESGIDEILRGDDLASSAPRQAYLAQLLGLPAPGWVQVPLVLNDSGQRLAKRDGAVTYQQLRSLGWSVEDVFAWMQQSLGFDGTGSRWRSVDDMIRSVDFTGMPTAPTVFVPPVGA